MKILAIDPGTKCGWARDYTVGVQCGTWDLQPSRFEGAGMRFVRLRNHLNELVATNPVHLVVVEEVRRHLGTDAAHIYGGIVATVQAWCEEMELEYASIPVGTIKKYATGKGNAPKQLMVTAARMRWGSQMVEDDNQADALWLLALAQERFGYGGAA